MEKKGKILKGKIISKLMNKTIVVSVDRFFKYPKYEKYIRRSKKYKVHNENNEYNIGDNVVIQECRPISKDKKFKVIKLI